MNKDEPDSIYPVFDRARILLGFSDGLNLELDELGFPDSTKRTAALAAATNLDRTQVYRLFKAEGGPSISTLASLRSIGVSVDRILDFMQSTEEKNIHLIVGNKITNARVQVNQSKNCSVILHYHTSGLYELDVLEIGEEPPPGALMVQCLSFPIIKSIALVDDDRDTLSLLSEQLQDDFRVEVFNNSAGLLAKGDKIRAFDIVMIDWRLPDTDGESFVANIRKNCNSPIFILTGDTSSSESIARALDVPNVHHVSKPASIAILIKRLNQSLIRKSAI